jgi:magnesium transporter
MPHTPTHLHETALAHARRDFVLVREAMTVEEALAEVRQQGVGERIIYFYVANDEGRLAGVLPTRRLLTAPPDARVGEIMVRRVVAIPQHATLLEACELFVLYKFLAFPVVDAERHMVGVLDIGVFTEEVLDLSEPDKANDTFELLGFHIEQARGASPGKAFRLRFPWLLATIASGTAGALLAGAFEATLARAVLVAFFLALVLALAESVSIQSMTLSLQALSARAPDWPWFWNTVRREAGTALLLGAGCGALVAAIVFVWRRSAPGAAVVGMSIVGSVGLACLLGVCVPALLHALKLDPKIAAGPITLAMTDVLTLLLYFSLATWLL